MIDLVRPMLSTPQPLQERGRGSRCRSDVGAQPWRDPRLWRKEIQEQGEPILVSPRRSSIAYVLGVALAVTIGVTLVYTVASLLGVSAPPSSDPGKSLVDYVIIALLLLLGVRVYLRRNESEPPKWMGKLATATPWFAFKLGFLLFLLMPTDVITMGVVACSWRATMTRCSRRSHSSCSRCCSCRSRCSCCSSSARGQRRSCRRCAPG